MAGKQRRRTGDLALKIRDAVGSVFSSVSFTAAEFTLPSEKGAQLSMTGEISALGNSVECDRAALVKALRSCPAMENVTGEELNRYIDSGCYAVLCGENDRSIAMAGVALEFVRLGAVKIVIAADTPAERDNLARAFETMHGGMGDIRVTLYSHENYDGWTENKAATIVYDFLESASPEILIIGRDSFSRRTNLLNQKNGEESLAALISRAHPVVLTSTQTIRGGCTIAKNAQAFDPAAVIMFTEEVKHIRCAVIYAPGEVTRKVESVEVQEQLGF